MAQNIRRREMLKLGLSAAVCAGAGVVARPLSAAVSSQPGLVLRAGIVTDMHQTSKPDSDTRKYSGSQAKMREFIRNMNDVKPDFIIELGDYVDMLGAGTDPAANLAEIESLFTAFAGPTYHVLGNHDFDNLTRDFVLANMPNTGIPLGQTYYSWDVSGVHCIVLDADYVPGSYRPYDMNTPADTFWTWVDTCIPPQELDWLRADLAATSLPTVVFTHQTLDRIDEQDHNIKNASEVRAVLEASGKVLAVISGHDHQGGYSNIKGIHYFVLNGNVGVNDYRAWDVTSAENGYGVVADNQFSVLEIRALEDGSYSLELTGYGRQPGYSVKYSA